MQYQIKTKAEPGTTVKLDAKDCTWEMVQDAVKIAAQQEGSDDESSIAKTCCSSIRHNIPALESWLKLLPDGDYGAVVCGLFKMIVGVLDPFLLLWSFCLTNLGCKTCK